MSLSVCVCLCVCQKVATRQREDAFKQLHKGTCLQTAAHAFKQLHKCKTLKLLIDLSLLSLSLSSTRPPPSPSPGAPHLLFVCHAWLAALALKGILYPDVKQWLDNCEKELVSLLSLLSLLSPPQFDLSLPLSLSLTVMGLCGEQQASMDSNSDSSGGAMCANDQTCIMIRDLSDKIYLLALGRASALALLCHHAMLQDTICITPHTCAQGDALVDESPPHS